MEDQCLIDERQGSDLDLEGGISLEYANRMMREKQYVNALDAYYMIGSRIPEISFLVDFNISICKKRLKENIYNDIIVSEFDFLDDHALNCIAESGLFDVEWYVNEYGDKYTIEINPLAHYLKYGAEKGLNPSERFNTKYYLKTNEDVVKAGIHPFVHYAVQGHAEGRRALPSYSLNYSMKYPVAEPKYIDRLSSEVGLSKKAVRVIAFYLPQFHAIPENDSWWGAGFTEWSNVKPAKPKFEGHYQPHVPDKYLGYYDLLDKSIQLKQIELAKQYGIEGFCFYLYWFSGKRLLEQPVDNYLGDSSLDLPFCVCWANENWSRRWDGRENDLLMTQHYSEQDDIDFISNVAKYLRDPRYIRISGKPLLLIYRPNLFPDMQGTVKRWRDWCRTNGIGEIYLVYPQSFEAVDPVTYNFDAATEFSPNNSNPPDITDTVNPVVSQFQNKVYDWRVFLERSELYKDPGYKLFRSACPSWDNTARKKNKGTIFLNSCPELFTKWLNLAFSDTLRRFDNQEEQIVFVNAWNEWAEGAHLEPDQKYGYAWLNAVREAHELTLHEAERHSYIKDIRWNKINCLFGGVVDQSRFAFLSDYEALLNQGFRKGIDFYIKNDQPACRINEIEHCLNDRSKMSALWLEKNKKVYSFVVLQYNNSKLTISCVESIKKIDRFGYDIRIVVIDNNSSAEHVDAIKHRFESDKEVDLIFSERNLGFSAGNNIGYIHAKKVLNAGFCVVLNNDTEIIQYDFIKVSVQMFEEFAFSIAGPDVCITDGRHENPWNDYVYDIDEFTQLYEKRSVERSIYIDGEAPRFEKIGRATPKEEIIINPLLQGAAFILSPIFIENYDRIFDERLFLYGEEFLLAVECVLRGHLNIYTNKLSVEHIEGATTATIENHNKIMLGYDSAIKSMGLCLERLERKKNSIYGKTVNAENIDILNSLLASSGPHVLIDLLFCQPGYHGAGEYGKAIFNKLAYDYATRGGFELWVALNSELFIDEWIWNTCKSYGINIIDVSAYKDITDIVNLDIFDSFFMPAIVAYAHGYEYMKHVGGRLPFTCKKTRVMGTLHDIRDYELAHNYRDIFQVRKNIGCQYELSLDELEVQQLFAKKDELASELKLMYLNIISDPHVDSIFTISDYCKDSICTNIGQPTKSMNIFMSPMKARPEPVQPDLRALGLESSKYALILHASREEKNAASAIRAFDELFKNDLIPSEFSVVLTGIDSVDDVGLNHINCPERFLAVGELAPGHLEYFLKNTAFLVYPSFNEGLGYPPIEAMSYGTFSVVSSVTAIPEVCENSVLYIDPYNIESIKKSIIDAVNSDFSNIINGHYAKICDKQGQDLENIARVITLRR